MSLETSEVFLRQAASLEPRGLRHDWRSWRYKFITGLISRYELGTYIVCCTVFYAEYLQDKMPKDAWFVLLVLIVLAFPNRHSVLRKLLETFLMSLSEGDNNDDDVQ